MTTEKDKAAAAGVLAALGGEIYDEGWPDALWVSSDKQQLLAIEWKRGTDSWRPGQRKVCDLFVGLGIPYCLARSHEGVLKAIDRVIEFPSVYRPMEGNDRAFAVEDDPRL